MSFNSPTLTSDASSIQANCFNTSLQHILVFHHAVCKMHAGITFCKPFTHFDNQQQTAFENIVGKEEIARNEQFLLFPQCFLLNQIPVILPPLDHIFDIIFLIAAELEEPKIGI